MNGKIQAIDLYRKTLDSAIATHFPELGPYLTGDQSSQDFEGPSNEVVLESETQYPHWVKIEL
ncbi:hypothetical protein BD410DRAFT_306 [Rickenella mellea]|uniref:Uncharacterized protein n=1 Tax=Rickenella mellea TaxID=50990 RepID=A0A4R5XFU1_9AGAM|nr:hypothetical protein BD410DRAFT_306 [Rickenella mellea]